MRVDDCGYSNEKSVLRSRIFLPPSLAASPVARCQPRVVRSPAVHAPGVRSGRSCRTQPTRPRSLPYGQPSAPVGLRIRAYSSPLRGLLPAACSARPTPPSGLMRGQRVRVVSVRHARPAAHTLRMAVRPAAVTRSSAHARSSGQRGRQRLQRNGYPAASAYYRPSHPCCSTCDRHSAVPARGRSRAATALLASRPHQLHQRAPAGSWLPT